MSTPPIDPLAGTFHRRELKAPCVSFSSTEGRELFKGALASGYLDVYFPLAEQYSTQAHPAFCGLSSLAMVLNALLIDPKRVWNGVWRWFSEEMLDCCDDVDLIKLQGINMPKLNCLAKCQGAATVLKFGSEVSIEELREDIKNSCSNHEHPMIIASYNRKILNQTGSGHFSPIGGYNADKDMILILDVARFKLPAHWAPLDTLYEAMQSIDKDTGKSRGYMLVSSSPDLERFCCCAPTESDEIVAESETDSTTAATITSAPGSPRKEKEQMHSKIVALEDLMDQADKLDGGCTDCRSSKSEGGSKKGSEKK